MTTDAERVTLGSILISSAALADCSEILEPSDFHHPRHEAIFAAALALASRGEVVDAVTVADELGAEVTKIGGAVYLHELVSVVPTAANGGYYADIVRKDSVRRRVKTIGERIATLPDADDPLEVVEAARGELEALAVREAGESTPETDLFQAIDDLERDPGTATPWHDLNEVLAGWKDGALYIVGARPGVGKSVVANAALLDMARRGKRALMFNLEMSKSEVYHRLLSSVGSIDMGRIQHRRLNPADWQRLTKAQAHIAALPLAVDDRGTIRVAQIRSKVRTIQRREPVGLVIVDYLQLMKLGRKVENRQQEVSEMSRALKLMAKELQVPVVALSQLNRGAVGPERMPQMSDLRESGALEQDADAVLLLHRDLERDPDALQILVAKNRHGPNDRVVRLAWEGQYARVSDQPNPYNESRATA